MTDTAPMYSLSIVSHGQGALIAALLADIETLPWNGGHSFEVIITVNIPENEEWLAREFSFPLKVLRNDAPKGFGANHNSAFAISQGQNFAVLNPDIRFADFRIGPMRQALMSAETGVCGPLVRGPKGSIEDSARRFPTFFRLVMRKLARQRDHDYAISAESQKVDWLAGMFLLFRADVFRAIDGFDDRYFMYMEDVEICRHLSRRGFQVIWVTSVSLVHDAARASRHNLQHMGWHAGSILRYFFARSRK